VDDDPFMRDVLTRSIGTGYEILTASSGAEALELIGSSEPIQVVISDQRMPGMSGAKFLQELRERHPQIVRILLTGETDLVEAVAAMNQAGLFRFLLKPGSRQLLLDTLRAAVEQYQLQSAERELLQQTLIGTMRALSDVLAIASPVAFGHVSRIQELALAVAARMNLPERWPLEFASLASQLGHIALPERTLRRLYAGEPLSAEESAQVIRSAHVAERILARIPRLGPVVDILSALAAGRKNDEPQPLSSVAAEILRGVSAFEAVERGTASRENAIHRLRTDADRFDPVVIRTLTEVLGLELSEETTTEVPLDQVRSGMVVAEDVCMRTGALLVPRSYRISESFLAKLRNFNPALLPKVIRVRASAND
jgi:FixJ family two-component response regulator